MQPFLKVRKEMESKRIEHVLEQRRLMYDLDALALDLHAVTTRREIADRQLELAQDGMIGINYPEKRIYDPVV